MHKLGFCGRIERNQIIVIRETIGTNEDILAHAVHDHSEILLCVRTLGGILCRYDLRKSGIFREACIITRRHLQGLAVGAPVGIGVQPGYFHELSGHIEALQRAHGITDGLRRVRVTIAVVDLAGGHNRGAVGGVVLQGIDARIGRDIKKRSVILAVDDIVEGSQPAPDRLTPLSIHVQVTNWIGRRNHYEDVVGAEVKLSGQGIAVVGSTDANGSCVFDNVAPGEYSITVYAVWRRNAASARARLSGS